MQDILPQLATLDTLYYDDLTSYETKWKEVVQQIETTFPGFSLAHVEIFTEGRENNTSGSMRHCLLSLKGGTADAV